MAAFVSIVVVALLLLTGISWFISRLAESRRAKIQRRERREIQRYLNRVDRSTVKIEKAARVLVMAGLTNGRKCPACQAVKPRDGFIQIGDDQIGRPIEVCGDCYVESQEGGGDA